MELFRLTASSFKNSWQWHVRNVLFHFLPVVSLWRYCHRIESKTLLHPGWRFPVHVSVLANLLLSRLVFRNTLAVHSLFWGNRWFSRVGHIWTFFCKSGIKRVVSMAKFGVEHEICQNIWPPMTFDTAKVRKFKMAAKMAYFAWKWLIFIQHVQCWLIACLFMGYLVKEHKFGTLNISFCTWVELHGKT